MVIFIEGARQDGIPISRALAFISIQFFLCMPAFQFLRQPGHHSGDGSPLLLTAGALYRVDLRLKFELYVTIFRSTPPA